MILCLGSNHEQQRHIAMAQELLQHHFAALRFTPCIWTEPVGVVSPQYLNCLAYGTTTLTYDALLTLTKNLEQRMGRSQEGQHRGEIPIDIDILLLGQHKYHLSDWDRTYVRQLLPLIQQHDICASDHSHQDSPDL